MVNRALFIGAHADDVEISAGGTILTLVDQGWEVWITHTEKASRQRMGEAIDAAHILGATYMPYSGDSRALVWYWGGMGIDLFVTPSAVDSHPEHREAADIGVQLSRNNNVELWQMNHAIPGGVVPAPELNHFVRFTISQATTKYRAITAHTSQIEAYGQWWIDAIRSRDRYYGLVANREDPVYVEGFRIVQS